MTIRTLLILLLVGIFCNVNAERQLVDENSFFKKQVSFTPPEQREQDERWLQKPAEKYKFPDCKMEEVNGVPFILVNGRRLSFFTRSVNSYVASGAPVERCMRENGVNSFMIDILLPESLSTAPQRAFDDFCKYADRILESVPDAFFMVRVWLPNVPEEFVKQHPDALLTGPDGKQDWGRTYHSTHNFRPNFLNEWRLYCGEILYKFLNRLGQSKYATHTVGVYVAAMNSGEWWYYKGAGDPGWDYSKTRQAAFKLYLQTKYADKLPELKKRWGVESDEELYRLPTFQERGDEDQLKPCSRVSDYNQVLNVPVTNAAIYFAEIIKNVSDGKLLAGMEIHAHLNIMNCNGTVFIRQLLECPYIDFLGGPPFYDDRNPGSSAPPHNVGASFRKHNKMFFVEGDFRTHTAYGTVSGALGEPPVDAAGSVEVMHREFMRGMLKQYPVYLMDFGWYWFYDPMILKDIAWMECLANFMAETGVRRNAEIALVSDQESQLYGNYFANATYLREHTMEKIGADYDYYELADFLAGDEYRKYKMVIFLNIRALNDAERAAINKLKSDGRMLVWFHDPGLTDLSSTDSNADENLYRLTGIKLHKAGKHAKIEIKPNIVELQRELPGINDGNFHYRGKGAEAEKARLWKQVSLSDSAVGKYVGNAVYDILSVDSEAVILGSDAAGQGRFVLKKFKDWSSVYTPSCLLPASIVRALALKAGCHIYIADNDICFSADKFVGLHAASAGVKNILLPETSDVYELFSRKVIARNVSKFSVPMNFGQTMLFYLGKPDTAIAQLEEIQARQQRDIAHFKENNPAPEVDSGAYNWSKASTPETFYKLRRKKIDSAFGPYPLRKQIPGAMLVSGPYPGAVDIRAMAQSIRSVSRPIDELEAPVLSRRTDKYLKLEKLLPDCDASKGVAGWRALSIDRPWIYADELGIGKGQSGLIAFYVVGKTGKEVEVVFRHHGDAELYVNGKIFTGEKSVVGSIFKLPERSNLFVIALRNSDGEAGFTCKFVRATTDLKPGKQVRKAAEGIGIFLTDENELKQKIEARQKQLLKADRPVKAASSPALTPAAFLISSTAAAELKNWIGKATLADIGHDGGKSLKVDCNTHLKYKHKFKVDPEIQYTLSAWMKTLKAGSRQPGMYIGFIAYDKNGRLIDTQSIHYFENTLTELAEPCKAGDSSIVIKSGASWQAEACGCVAFNADKTGGYKDIPNFNCSAPGISKVYQSDENWTVQLKAPLKKGYPAGTAVREHKFWAHYNFINGGKPGLEWKRYYGSIKGVAENTPERGKWWPGTDSVQVVICVNSGKDTAPLLIDDIELTVKGQVERKEKVSACAAP